MKKRSSRITESVKGKNSMEKEIYILLLHVICREKANQDKQY